MDQELPQIFNFLKVAENLKLIERRSLLSNNSRSESVAEHCWSMLIIAFLLKEKIAPEVNMQRVYELIIFHDIAEVFTGDLFKYDKNFSQDKKQQDEEVAFENLKKLLPPRLQQNFDQVYKEYNERITPESKYVKAIDQLSATLQNYFSNGYAWKKYGISKKKIEEDNRKATEFDHIFQDFLTLILTSAEDKDLLP